MKDNIFEEIERLRAFNSELSLTTGILRGMICGLKCYLSQDQLNMLDDIDKNITLMFFTHQFEAKKTEGMDS